MDRNPHGNSWFRRGVPRFSSTLQNRFAAILAAPQFLVPCLLAVGVSLWFLHIADDSLAQIGGVFPTLRSGDKDEDAGNDAVQFPTDRDKNVALQRARDLVRKQQFSDGGLALDRILADPQDVFYKPDPKQPVYRSIKAEAQHILGNMSEEGLATYELQFGANSQRLLDEAIQSGSLFELGQVIRRYFHTAAGYQAALLLGRNHLDNGRPLAAALLFERLLQAPVAERKFEPGLSILLATSWQRAGAPEKAQKVLDALKKSKAGQTTQIAGKETAVLAPDGDSLEWLNKLVGKIEVATSMAVASNWTMASGNASRNALSNGASPLLNHRWRVKSAMTKAIQDELMRARKQSSDSGRAVVPALQPLAVDGVVIMRTPQGGMWGIDFASGKLEWEPGSNRSAIESPSNVGRESAYMQSLSQRTWENATFGTLSSAGDLVFSIDDSEDQTAKVAQYSGRPRMLFPGGGMGEMPQVTAGYNLLSARSLKNRQGALQWQVGGSAGNADPSKPESAQLAGAFFLGPPLPLQGQLYVLAEIKSGISLVVLDAKTGKVDWIQQLAFIDGTESQDPSRRLAGASPSFADGILVCPTAAGAVVAVDLSTRSLMWGFQFPLSAEQEMLRQQNMHRFGMGSPSTGPRSQWLDSTAVVANGKVYLTARESDQIHCLSLVDGKQVWSKKRDSGLYIGAVQGHRLLLVSEQQVQALNADSGRQIWSLSLGSSRPSGRGYFSDGNYFLPLSTAEVVKIDLAKGEITNRSKSRSGIVPGNLVCYEGHILSQGVESLDKFFQLEPLRAQVQLTLAKNPNDPEALAWRGEIALDEGNLSQAIADLRTAYSNPVAQDGDPVYLSRIEGERSRMRELLLDGLASAIEKDFAKSEPLLRELEQLVTLESERAGYLRLVGDGNQAAGNVVAALDAYMELADLKNQPGEIEFISLDWSVRRDRWIQARLESLWKSSAGPNRKAIDEKIALKLSQATGEDAVQGDVPDGTLQAKKALSATGSRIEPLRNFISRFSFHPSSEVARVMLLSMLGGAETLLEQEKLLHELSLSEDPARKREAIARLANFYESVGLANDSAKYYRRLETEFADVPCLEGKTGRELAASLAPKGDVRLAMGFSASNWPFGEVKSEQVRGVMTRKEYQRSSQQYRPVELRGLPGSFADSHLHLDQISSQASKLVCRDNLGREQFRLSVPEANLIYNYGFQQVPTYAYARGRLLIVNTGLHLHAVDTLRPPTKNIIWQKELIDPVQIQQMRFQGIETSRRDQENPWGLSRPQFTSIGNQQVCAISPILGQGICLQQGRELVFLDALTGQQLWTRNVPFQADEIFGDDEVLIVAPQDGTEAYVLRTADGTLLGKRAVPDPAHRWATHGRSYLTWRSRGASMELFLKNIWTQQETKLGKYLHGSKGVIVNSNAVAVYDSIGKFRMHSLVDGRQLLEAEVEPDASLINIFVVQSQDQYFVVSNRQVEGNAMNEGPSEISYQPVVDYNNNIGVISGRVYAFDRKSGEPSWPSPVTFEQHGFLEQQGGDLPFLVFARHVQDRHTERSGNPNLSILCIEKRTGRAAYQKEDLQTAPQGIEVSADPASRTVSLQFSGQSVNLALTDNPIPPEPPYQVGLGVAKDTKSEGSVIGGVLRWFVDP